jgi:hypothetical protein
MEEIKKQAKEALKKVYDKYNSLGLEAIYLDGSILTKDFDLKVSDVDSIGIVNDSFPVELEDVVKDFLSKEYPQIRQFGFRLLYKSELNGDQIKSFLASVIQPELLLFALPDWELVIGKSFSQTDFKLPILSYRRLRDMEIRNFYKFNWTEVSKIKEGYGGHINLLKTIIHIIDFEQKEKGIMNNTFSPLLVLDNTEGEEKEIMEFIMENKKNNWDYSMFRNNSSFLQKYVNKLLSSISN